MSPKEALLSVPLDDLQQDDFVNDMSMLAGFFTIGVSD
jgi:hypothetical protein